jgi:hypothetical protein
MNGIRPRPSGVSQIRQVNSAGEMPAACTRTSASPGWSAGVGNIFVDEHFRAAAVMDANRLHGVHRARACRAGRCDAHRFCSHFRSFLPLQHHWERPFLGPSVLFFHRASGIVTSLSTASRQPQRAAAPAPCHWRLRSPDDESPASRTMPHQPNRRGQARSQPGFESDP